ncbi:tRNA preQ1(34) S-adenosylmethionine ribosyltransferase-isomerase QueA [Planctomicrobium sp. SH668]|uniref:tRNA preQ1(34) S-adenosylmethionine ribosyltransferase-isomerase QueA n=1 Tax=Planctomicrobium sp. SH668 TaxID=3448126 RepID=UPI003F5BB1B9
MNLDDTIDYYDYHLPEELIAQEPIAKRDASRLMVVDRKQGAIEHRQFTDLPTYLQVNDLLVMNDTRVVPARLIGIRTATGGKWEGLFLRKEGERDWRIIGQTRGTLQPGERITLLPPLGQSDQEACHVDTVEILLKERHEGGEWVVEPQSDVETFTLLSQYGVMPLPHYMKRDAVANDLERYQTTYAERPGAVAAPTAGLHFTPELFAACKSRGVESARVTLHVGLGTFRPVSVQKLADHKMHSEWFELPQGTVKSIEAARNQGGRVVAVGTTTVRTLESAAKAGPLAATTGDTNLFIRPPFEFQAVDAMITNFHLPKSTLLVLVSTFAGRELVKRAYEEAVAEKYRFFSYGDAMLIL